MSDGWVPEFPGQRPPFAVGNPHRVGEGNALARTHGAYSADAVAPLAVEIEAAARGDASWPPYLTDPSYGAAVEAWAHSEAVVTLLRRYVAERPFDEAMSDMHSEETQERHRKGSSTRTTTGRRTRAALDLLDRWEARAAGHRSRLGLDPLSRAKLGRDVTAAQVDLVQLLTDARERHEQGEAS